jgi:hypothetical protein
MPRKTYRQVVAQMRAIHRHGFAVGQDAYIFPIHFVVAKARPAMRATFHQELFQRSTFGRGKEQLARIGVVKVDFARRIRCCCRFLNILDKCRLFKITTVVFIVGT